MRNRGTPNPQSTACAACRHLRRKCTNDCVFAPHFPQNRQESFDSVHRAFGASNVAKLLSNLPPDQRSDAVHSLIYEADARKHDPVYGCVGFISVLQKNLKQVRAELQKAKQELAQIVGPTPYLTQQDPPNRINPEQLGVRNPEQEQMFQMQIKMLHDRRKAAEQQAIMARAFEQNWDQGMVTEQQAIMARAFEQNRDQRMALEQQAIMMTGFEQNQDQRMAVEQQAMMARAFEQNQDFQGAIAARPSLNSGNVASSSNYEPNQQFENSNMPHYQFIQPHHQEQQLLHTESFLNGQQIEQNHFQMLNQDFRGTTARTSLDSGNFASSSNYQANQQLENPNMPHYQFIQPHTESFLNQDQLLNQDFQGTMLDSVNFASSNQIQPIQQLECYQAENRDSNIPHHQEQQIQSESFEIPPHLLRPLPQRRPNHQEHQIQTESSQIPRHLLRPEPWRPRGQLPQPQPRQISQPQPSISQQRMADIFLNNQQTHEHPPLLIFRPRPSRLDEGMTDFFLNPQVSHPQPFGSAEGITDFLGNSQQTVQIDQTRPSGNEQEIMDFFLNFQQQNDLQMSQPPPPSESNETGPSS